MKMTTRMMTTVIAAMTMMLVAGACRGPNGPDYPESEATAMQNQPFTPHSVSVGR